MENIREQLLPESLVEKFKDYPLYSQERKGTKAKVVAHYFLGGCDWWATEGQPTDDDFTFFGVVKLGNMEPEFGYFSLSELCAKFNIPIRMNGEVMFKVPAFIERDEYWEVKTVDERNIDGLFFL